eukprot:5909259-Amphidinium_carterae.1
MTLSQLPRIQQQLELLQMKRQRKIHERPWQVKGKGEDVATRTTTVEDKDPTTRLWQTQRKRKVYEKKAITSQKKRKRMWLHDPQ